MYEVFCDFRDVVIYDVSNMGDVDAAGGDVGCDEDAMASFGEALEGLIALSLRTIAVNLGGGVAGTDQAAGNAVGTMLGANEDQEAAFAGLE